MIRENSVRRVGSLFGLLLLFHCIGAFAAAPAEQTDELWDYFGTILLRQLCPADNCEDVQIVSEPRVLDWYGEYGLYNMLTDLNRVSKPAANFIPINGKGLYESYRDFILNINLDALGIAEETKAQTAARKAAELELSRAAERYDTASRAFGPAWSRQVKADEPLTPAARRSYRDFLNKSKAGKEWAAARDDLESATRTYVRILVANGFAGSGLTNAIDAARSKGHFVNVQNVPPSVIAPELPSYTTVPTTQSLLDTLRAGFGAKSWDTDWNRLEVSKTWLKIKARGGGFGGSFFAFGRGNYTKHTIDRKTANFFLKLDFTGLTSVDVYPGSWFVEQMIDRYQFGPWQNPNLWGGTPYPFGPEGEVAQRPMTLLVGYGPKVTIKAGEAQYKFLREAWSAGASIGIGPIGFSGKGEGGREYSFDENQQGTVTLSDTSGRVWLLAVRNQVYLPPKPAKVSRAE